MKTEIPQLPAEQIAVWQHVVDTVRLEREAAQPTEWVHHRGKRKLDPYRPVKLASFLRRDSLQHPKPNLVRYALAGFIAGVAVLAVAAWFSAK
jgi:hypothetical protein